MGFETQYLGFLPSVAHWSIADATLTLTDAGGATLLIFSGQPSTVQLEGVDWLATSVLQAGAMTAIPADIGTTLTLTDGQATGSTGCNRYFGGYTLSGTSLTFAPLASTEMACPEPRMAIESAWLTALGLVTGWSVDGDQLHLLDAAGNDLAVLAPVVATGVVGTWTLGEIAQDGTLAMIMSDASVTFGEDGSLTGTTGCNNLMSDYAVDGDAIKIGPVATTKMACKDPSAQGIETALLAALEGATGWHTTIDGWLELTDATGAVLAGFVPGTVAAS
jgi:heat shock protein HslJ